MRLSALLLSIAMMASSSNASLLKSNPAHYHRFLQEIDAVREELVAWKQSEAGQVAKANGYYQDAENARLDAASQPHDHLERFFLTKLGIEEAQKTNPEATFSTDTPFTLLTDEEFAAFVGKSYQVDKLTGLTPEEDVVNTNSTTTVTVTVTDADVTTTKEDEASVLNSVDWTTSGCVSAVKDQGNCGSCWAFAAIGALETASCQKTSRLQLLSEQEVTSCETQMGGCQGGFPSYALQYIQRNGGACTAQSYPFTSGYSQQTGQCNPYYCQRYSIQIRQVASTQPSVQGYMNALSRVPLAIGVAAGNNVWKQYRGGIVSSCPNNQLDHAVVAVGYGPLTNWGTYFKIKNSWGTQWGEQGYIRVNGGVNACGMINKDGAYPIL